MHALIVGPRGVGKSTLIRRVLRELDLPIWGFETKKEDALADHRGSPIYLYDAGAPHVRCPERLLGLCKEERATPIPAAFDRCAPRLRHGPPPGHLVLLDEVGFLESSSPAFCRAVLALLDSDSPVLAAVKDKNTPFLAAVRAHPKARCFFITEENRDDLFLEVLTFLRAQTAAGSGR